MKKIIFLIILYSMVFSAVFKVKYIVGNVKEYNNGKMKRLKYNSIIRQSSRIKTGPGSFIAIAGEDGSVIKIAANSSITFKKLILNNKKRTMKVKVSYGKIFAKISKMKVNSEITFITPTAIAGIRGTYFVMMVPFPTFETKLYVFEGDVLYGRTFESSISVKGNQVGTISPEGITSVKKIGKKELNIAIKGIPFKIKMKTEIINIKKDDINIDNFKEELMETIAENKESMIESQEEINQLKFWDIETQRSMGDILIKQSYKKLDDKRIEIITWNMKTGSSDYSYIDIITTFPTGVPEMKTINTISDKNIFNDLSYSIEIGNIVNKNTDKINAIFDDTGIKSMNWNGKKLNPDTFIQISSWDAGQGIFDSKIKYSVLTIDNERITFDVSFSLMNSQTGKILTENDIENLKDFNDILDIAMKSAGKIIINSKEFHNGTIQIIMIADIVPSILFSSFVD